MCRFLIDVLCNYAPEQPIWLRVRGDRGDRDRDSDRDRVTTENTRSVPMG